MRTVRIRWTRCLPLALLPIAGIVTLASLSAQLKPTDEMTFSLAVLRRDGVLVPFAHFDRRRWSNPWPEPSTGPDAPIRLEGVSPKWLRGASAAGPWTMWTLDGQASPLQVTSPTVFEAHCLGNVGLQTTYRSAEPVALPHVQPYPKDAVAVLGGARLGRIEVALPDSPQRALLASSTAFIAWFGDAERKAVDNLSRRQGWRHPTPAKQRDAQPITVEALYRSRYSAGGVVSYFEATRRYKWPGDKDAGCDLITQVQGWLVTQPSGEMSVHTVSGNLYDCEMRGAAFMLPLGVIALEGRGHWIVQWSGWGYEQYAVIEVGDQRVRTVLRTPGGGC
ncbi:MAG: hypothetical protein HYZ58_18580 [Acidobacteria bacterium]|nr:hypothetical protein [Acidobacteriota bacterium]